VLPGGLGHPVSGGGALAGLIESPAHIGILAPVQERYVNGASSTVRGCEAVGRDKPGVFVAQCLIGKVRSVSPELIQVPLPQALLDSDGAPALFKLKLVLIWQALPGASEPVGNPRTDIKQIVGQLLHVHPALVNRQRRNIADIDKRLVVIEDSQGQHAWVINEGTSVAICQHDLIVTAIGKTAPR